MTRCIIFDLSEVLIAGLPGIEKALSRELSRPEDGILPCFGGRLMEELCLGNLSEEAYLNTIIAREGWEIDLSRLKGMIRENFHRQVDGTLSILTDLAPRYELALHSDHVREWISYIRTVHTFMGIFQQSFFSYELNRLKNDPEAFLKVLDELAIPPEEALFIDDNPKNVQAARSVGIWGIHFLSARQLIAELKELGYWSRQGWLSGDPPRSV